jgi:hypothetical protein
MENYQILSNQISDIRLLLNRADLNTNTDIAILNAYEELAFYVISNFELPGSHLQYILSSLGKLTSATKDTMISEIISKHKSIQGAFDIEIPLRAIESYYSWGRPDNIDLEKLIEVKYLIAKLHSLVGDKTIKLKTI